MVITGYILICLVIFSVYFLKRKRNEKILKELTKNFGFRINLRANVVFGKFHKLTNTKILIQISNKKMVLVGFDSYRGRFTKFLFTNDDSIDRGKIRFPIYHINQVYRPGRNKIILKASKDQQIVRMEFSKTEENTIAYEKLLSKLSDYYPLSNPSSL